jgi:hypothetical protein
VSWRGGQAEEDAFEQFWYGEDLGGCCCCHVLGWCSRSFSYLMMFDD